MEALAYYDGKIGTPEELMVPFNDRVHFFGDGVYDATVGANGKVYLMQDHLDRFYTSAKALDINIPMPKEELGKLLTDLLAKVDGTTHFVYWQVTRGVETRNHVYAEKLPGKLWVSIRQNHLNDPDVPIKLDSAEDTRFYHCNIKTLNLLPSVVAAQHAKRIGVQETVFHRGDIVTECAHSNAACRRELAQHLVNEHKLGHALHQAVLACAGKAGQQGLQLGAAAHAPDEFGMTTLDGFFFHMLYDRRVHNFHKHGGFAKAFCNHGKDLLHVGLSQVHRQPFHDHQRGSVFLGNFAAPIFHSGLGNLRNRTAFRQQAGADVDRFG